MNESLSKRMQKFREARGEQACPWPAYWIADAGALEGEIMILKKEMRRIPELLAALKLVMSYSRAKECMDSQAVSLAEAVIAKTEGKS